MFSGPAPFGVNRLSRWHELIAFILSSLVSFPLIVQKLAVEVCQTHVGFSLLLPAQSVTVVMIVLDGKVQTVSRGRSRTKIRKVRKSVDIKSRFRHSAARQLRGLTD